MDRRLLEAVREGDTFELQKLLGENDFMLERCSLNESSETILHVACLAGQTESVRVLLEKKADLAARLNPDGFSAIHIASANGFDEIVIELLNVNGGVGRLKSSDGRTSLHCAAITGMVPVVKALLERCPDCKDDVTSRGETALHLAVKNNQFEVFKAMVDMIKQFNIKELLNATDKDGNTILHLATANRQTQILKLLLDGQDIEKGTVSVNVINKNGLTALDVLDVVQQMLVDRTDYTLWELIQGAQALRAKEIADIDMTQVDHQDSISIRELPSQNFMNFLLKEVKLLNPLRYYRRLAKEIKETPAETKNALIVVAALTATMTYQAILSPPNNFSSGDNSTNPPNNFSSGDKQTNPPLNFPSGDNHTNPPVKNYMSVSPGNMSVNHTLANISGSPIEFFLFMGPNSIGFFASLTVIYLLTTEFPLKPLLRLAVRCMAASYICGLLLIGPTRLHATHLGLVFIGTIVLVDFVSFGFWLFKRASSKDIRQAHDSSPGDSIA